MDILLINIMDSAIGGTSAFIYFQTILGKKKTKLPFYLLLLTYIISFIVYSFLTSILNGNTSIIATIIRLCLSTFLMLMLSFLFQTNIKIRILVALSYPILVSLFEYFSYFIITSIFSYKTSEGKMDPLVFSSISLTSSLLLFFFSMLLHTVWKKQLFNHSFIYALVQLVMPALSTILLMSKPILYLNINQPSAYFMIAAFVLIINLMNYILLYNVLETEELRFQVMAQNDQLQLQKSKYQQLGAAYKNIRSFMHDTKKHLFYIENCVNSEKYDEIIPYSQEIMRDLESRYCKINTGNLVIDAFISNLLLQTKSKGIILHTNLEIDNSIIPISDYHLTIILGNLLDNALNASRGQVNAQINVTIKTKNDVFTIHVSNTYAITTSKKSTDDSESIDFIHGYGLNNVNDIAEACGGFCTISQDNSIYSVTVIIPLKTIGIN